MVGYGAIAVVVEVIDTVAAVLANTEDGEGLVLSKQRESIAFDTAIGEIDAEQQILRGTATVQGARRILRIDDAFSGLGIAIGKVEVLGVDEGSQPGGIGAFEAARVDPTEIHQ